MQLAAVQHRNIFEEMTLFCWIIHNYITSKCIRVCLLNYGQDKFVKFLKSFVCANLWSVLQWLSELWICFWHPNRRAWSTTSLVLQLLILLQPNTYNLNRCEKQTPPQSFGDLSSFHKCGFLSISILPKQMQITLITQTYVPQFPWAKTLDYYDYSQNFIQEIIQWNLNKHSLMLTLNCNSLWNKSSFLPLPIAYQFSGVIQPYHIRLKANDT